jgi:drug/metabolite transporter (DMT)-like permease
LLLGILAGLASGALWGLVFVAPILAPGVSPVDLAAGRFIVFGLVSACLMAFGLLRGTSLLPTWRQAAAAMGLSVLGFSGYYLLLVCAIRNAGVEVPTLMIGTIPVWVMVLGKSADLQWRRLLPGLLLTFVGIALMAYSQDISASAAQEGFDFWIGLIFAAIATACWVAFAILNSAWLQRHKGMSLVDWTSWLGVGAGLSACLLWAAVGTPIETSQTAVSTANAAAVYLATGIGSSWGATILWNFASRRLSASLCGQLIVSETLFALVYSFYLQGNRPDYWQWLASAIFLMGVIASIQAHRLR